MNNPVVPVVSPTWALASIPRPPGSFVPSENVTVIVRPLPYPELTPVLSTAIRFVIDGAGRNFCVDGKSVIPIESDIDIFLPDAVGKIIESVSETDSCKDTIAVRDLIKLSVVVIDSDRDTDLTEVVFKLSDDVTESVRESDLVEDVFKLSDGITVSCREADLPTDAFKMSDDVTVSGRETDLVEDVFKLSDDVTVSCREADLPTDVFKLSDVLTDSVND